VLWETLHSKGEIAVGARKAFTDIDLHQLVGGDVDGLDGGRYGCFGNSVLVEIKEDILHERSEFLAFQPLLGDDLDVVHSSHLRDAGQHSRHFIPHEPTALRQTLDAKFVLELPSRVGREVVCEGVGLRGGKGHMGDGGKSLILLHERKTLVLARVDVSSVHNGGLLAHLAS